MNVLAAAARHGTFAAWKGCRGVVEDTLSPFRALISVDGPCRFIFVDVQVSQPEVPLDGGLIACAVLAFPDVKIGKMLGRHGACRSSGHVCLGRPTLFK